MTDQHYSMKQLFLIFCMAFVISSNAQEERTIIDSSLLMANYIIYHPKEEQIIPIYGKDYKIKLRNNIKQLTPLVNSENITINAGSILGIVYSYSVLIDNNRLYQTGNSQMEIMKDLMSLKAAFDIGFTKEENNFKKNKENFILSYELSDKINYAELKKSYFTFLSIFKFYYLPTHPSYLECLDRTLLHFVLLRNDSKKNNEPVNKRVALYNNAYFNLLQDNYEINIDLLNRTETALFKPEINEELAYKLANQLPFYSDHFLKRKFDSVEDLAEIFHAMIVNDKFQSKSGRVNFTETFTCLNIIYNKLDAFLLKKDGVSQNHKLWFESELTISANQFLNDFENSYLNKKIDPKLFNPFVIFLEFDPENSIDFRKRYGPGFDQKFLHSLISALKIAFTNYKTWREIDLNLFYNNLVTTLSALKKYYTWENDPIELAKINNCFKVLKEEKTVNAGEVKDAIDAL